MKNECLENLILKGHIEGKIDKRRACVIGKIKAAQDHNDRKILCSVS